MRIVAPDGKIMYDGEQESSGKFTFAAHTPGIYTYCFSNQKGTMTPKVVMFNMDIGETPKQPELIQQLLEGRKEKVLMLSSTM